MQCVESRTVPLINDFCYKDHCYHWIVIQGRNESRFHLGISQDCNKIESFITKSKHGHDDQDSNIHHSLIKTFRQCTKKDILSCLIDCDIWQKSKKNNNKNKKSLSKNKNDNKDKNENNKKTKTDESSVDEKSESNNTDDNIDNENKEDSGMNKNDLINSIQKYDWECNDCGNNNKIERKHGLILAYSGHGDKNGNMWIGDTRSKPTLKEKKKFIKQQRKLQKKNLVSQSNYNLKQYNSKHSNYSQSISLEWIISNVFEIIMFYINNFNVMIDHLIILHNGCQSGNWCFNLNSILSKYNKMNNNMNMNDIINISIVTASNKNEKSYEIQGNPNNGGRFYNLLLYNSIYNKKDKNGKNSKNDNKGCIDCESVLSKKKTNYKKYYKHNKKCEHLNNETILANHNKMLIEWSNDINDISVTQSKFN